MEKRTVIIRNFFVLGIAAVLFFVSASSGAERLEGTLSTDMEVVRVGDEVTLLLKISGRGEARSYEIDQPNLLELKHFKLLTVSQRNETEFDRGRQDFSISFLYRLKAVGTGTESIPDINVRYRGEGEGEDHAMTIRGLDIAVKTAGWGVFAAVLLGVIVLGIILLVAIISRMRRTAGPKEVPYRAEGMGRGKSDAAVRALARLEEASRLKMEGDVGGYCSGLLEAISGYLQGEQGAELNMAADRLGKLCERLKYAKDREVEAEVKELERKAELFLKNKIREEIE